jgi:Xaa-Pro aminopeptidase
MKSDLDLLMKDAKLDAILILGNAENNPPMYYFTGGGYVSNAALFKKPDMNPVLYCNSMEREEAAKSGLSVIPLQTGATDALAKKPKEIFEEQGITSGRLGLYGKLDVGEVLIMTLAIREAFPQLELIGEGLENSIFMRAMETKDQGEVTRIRKMGKITTEVVG